MPYYGSFDIDWRYINGVDNRLQWAGYMYLNVTATIRAVIDDAITGVDCWVESPVLNADQPTNTNGGGFYNAGGIMWSQDQEQGPTPGNYVYSDDNPSSDTAARAEQDLVDHLIGYTGNTATTDAIAGIVCCDKVGSSASLLSSCNAELYNETNPKHYDFDTPGVVPQEKYVIRGFSRWYNWTGSPTFDSSYTDYSMVGNVAVGLICLEDLFPDYFPWAIRKGGIWYSANRSGGSHRILKVDGWRDDKNNFLQYKNQTAFQIKQGSWTRSDEIGVE